MYKDKLSQLFFCEGDNLLLNIFMDVNFEELGNLFRQ